MIHVYINNNNHIYLNLCRDCIKSGSNVYQIFSDVEALVTETSEARACHEGCHHLCLDIYEVLTCCSS